MGHRALVAYERADGRYSVHYSHWGAADLRLTAALTPATPFGASEPAPPSVRDAFERLTVELAAAVAVEAPEAAVDPRPIAVGLTLERVIADRLDFLHHEAFYVVSPAFEVTAYRTLWFGLQDVCRSVLDDPTVGYGALVSPLLREGEAVDDEYLRGWFRGTKELVGALIDADRLDRSTGTAWLRRRVRQWADADHQVRFPSTLREND